MLRLIGTLGSEARIELESAYAAHTPRFGGSNPLREDTNFVRFVIALFVVDCL
jgi:hypothetical protein